jgi:predicted lipid-binding transport protein (Tim44 family)
VARTVLADPRFSHAALKPPQRTLLDLIGDWLIGVLRGLLHGIDHALGAHNGFEAALGFAVIAAALAVLGWAVFLLVRSLAGRRRGRRPAVGMAGAVSSDGNSAALRAAAVAAARAGRYREAAALLFLAAVRTLDERGRVAYDPARTPGEYRRLVRDPCFDALAADAVVALFAAAEPAGELFERMRATDERFVNSLA